MGKWRRCDDCPRGFSSLVKLEVHQKADHPIQVLTSQLHWMLGELQGLETTVRRYWDAKAALESLTPIPPGAREILQEYVIKYDGPWLGHRTRLCGMQDRVPDLRKAVDNLRDRIRRATYMRPVP